MQYRSWHEKETYEQPLGTNLAVFAKKTRFLAESL